MEFLREIIINGFKQYGAQIVSIVLMGISLWLFPSLRRFVRESLLNTIDKIFGKSRLPKNNEAENFKDIPEEAHFADIEDTDSEGIPEWFKTRRKKEKRVKITKEGVLGIVLLCLGLFILIFSLWRVNLTNFINLIEDLVNVLVILIKFFFLTLVMAVVTFLMAMSAIMSGVDDSKGADSKGADSKGADSKGADSKGADSKGADSKGADSKGAHEWLIVLMIIFLISPVVFYKEIYKALSEALYPLDFLNLLWVLGVLAGCAFGFLAFRIIDRNINAHITAAERGNAEAQYKLGKIYYKKGIYKLSYMWYRLASLCGYKQADTAMTKAAVMISGSVLVNCKEEAQRKFDRIMRTKKKLIPYYRAQALKGNKIAQYNLGYVYQHGGDLDQNGEYVKQDNYSAYVWYYVAMLSGDWQAKSRLSQLKDEFLPSQIEQAEAEAKKKFNAIQHHKAQN